VSSDSFAYTPIHLVYQNVAYALSWLDKAFGFMEDFRLYMEDSSSATYKGHEMSRISKRTTWAVRILTTLVILAFVPSGIMKVIHHPTVLEGFGRMGIPQGASLPLGIVELSCLALYLIPRSTVLGTLLLTAYLGGATLANIISRSDCFHALVVGLLVWAGAWLRVPEFRALVPVRKTRSSTPIEPEQRKHQSSARTRSIRTAAATIVRRCKAAELR
jgi:hypothetical protein